MTTKWVEEHWWFPWKDSEEAKVEAFREWLGGADFEVCVNGVWEVSHRHDRVYANFSPNQPMRPIHPHRALIDQYELCQEWEIGSRDGTNWVELHDEPTFETDCSYRLKQSSPIVDWSAMPSWVEWVAMHQDGRWEHFEGTEPFTIDDGDGGWWSQDAGCSGIIPEGYAPKFTGDWKQSKVRRPR